MSKNREKGWVHLDTQGVTKEELSLLLAKDPENELPPPLEPTKDLTILPRSKRHRKKKRWIHWFFL
jgi:hypothetical protein